MTGQKVQFSAAELAGFDVIVDQLFDLRRKVAGNRHLQQAGGGTGQILFKGF